MFLGVTLSLAPLVLFLFKRQKADNTDTPADRADLRKTQSATSGSVVEAARQATEQRERAEAELDRKEERHRQEAERGRREQERQEHEAERKRQEEDASKTELDAPQNEFEAFEQQLSEFLTETKAELPRRTDNLLKFEEQLEQEQQKWQRLPSGEQMEERLKENMDPLPTLDAQIPRFGEQVEEGAKVFDLMETLRRRQRRYCERLEPLAQRVRLWKDRTGLLPPENRGFVPAREGDERESRLDPAYEKGMALDRERLAEAEEEDVEPYPHKPKWSLPATPDDTDPSWHNVVRAYEDCWE